MNRSSMIVSHSFNEAVRTIGLSSLTRSAIGISSCFTVLSELAVSGIGKI